MRERVRSRKLWSDCICYVGPYLKHVSVFVARFCTCSAALYLERIRVFEARFCIWRMFLHMQSFALVGHHVCTTSLNTLSNEFGYFCLIGHVKSCAKTIQLLLCARTNPGSKVKKHPCRGLKLGSRCQGVKVNKAPTFSIYLSLSLCTCSYLLRPSFFSADLCDSLSPYFLEPVWTFQACATCNTTRFRVTLWVRSCVFQRIATSTLLFLPPSHFR